MISLSLQTSQKNTIVIYTLEGTGAILSEITFCEIFPLDIPFYRYVSHIKMQNLVE